MSLTPTSSIRSRLRRANTATASQGGQRSAVHGVIELVEKVLVIFLSLFSGETQRIDFFDADLFRVRLALQDRHDFFDELFQWHRPWIPSLLVAHQSGLNVRRDELDHFDVCRLELVTE